MEIMNDSGWRSRAEVVKRVTENWDESNWERRTEVIKSKRRVKAHGRRLEVRA
jgi:hypothetical protein